jgi:hypothetical protein
MKSGRCLYSLRCAALCVAWLGLSACPEGAAQKLSERCSKAYEKCLLPNGVLGVCDTVACEPDKAPPCLVCRSQH